MPASSSSAALASLNIKNSWLNQWIYFLTAGLMYAAVFLRSVIGFQKSLQFGLIITLLLAWAFAFIGSVLLVRRYPWVFSALIGLEILIILSLLLITHSIRSDLFAYLFAVTAMQVMQQYTPHVTAVVIGSSALMTFFNLFQVFGALQALALTFAYTALSIFLAAYIWTTRQARSIQAQQRALTTELQDANSRLDDYTHKMRQLATIRERQRLARELHDSVAQTVFSMTLATQTARMSMKRDPRQVSTQLDRLGYLAESALSEMQKLVYHLNPEDRSVSFLEVLKQHLAERERLDGLTIALVVDGNQSLSEEEETILYRIAREALNNIVKHGCTTTAVLRLHLAEPFFMEIEDHGVGFDQNIFPANGKMGLAGMRERAAEIGWTIEIKSSLGQGCLVRVQKGP